MALILTGIVIGMRPVGGIVEEGPRKGERWEFLSMEISDTRFGKVYSCQLNDNDRQYADIVNGKDDLKEDYTGHKVKVTIKGMTAGEREVKDKTTGEKRVILQIRTQITNIRDLGVPDDEDE